MLPLVLQVLSRLPVTVMAASAGKIELHNLPPNVFAAEFLPMDVAARPLRLVISNGGSLTTYQALASGVPVIGLCSNMDQLMNMNAVERMGAGIMFRAARMSSSDLKEAVTTLLDNVSYSQAASRAAKVLLGYDAGQRFREFVAKVLN